MGGAKIGAVDFSPDGCTLLTGSADGTVAILDMPTGKYANASGSHTDVVFCAVFSPDGSMALTGSLDFTATLWIVSTGECAKTLAGHEHMIVSVAFSHDGSMVRATPKEKSKGCNGTNCRKKGKGIGL